MSKLVKRSIKEPFQPKYDPAVHCGTRYIPKGKRKSKICLRLKGEGTNHPGIGKCEDHRVKEPRNYYKSMRPSRLGYLLDQVRENTFNPSDVINELEILRAMTLAFIQDHQSLEDPETILQASDLLAKIMKGAQQYQQIQQAETLHIKTVELIHIQMAEHMIRGIKEIADPSKEGWRDKLIEWIKDHWAAIAIERDVKKLEKQSAQVQVIEAEVINHG